MDLLLDAPDDCDAVDRPAPPLDPVAGHRGTDRQGAGGGGAAVPLSGQGLRYALSLELRRSGELSVRALIQRLEAAGFQIVGRPSKTVSDALRWEIGNGRVVRVGRGRYRTDRIPRSTIRWMQRALEQWRARWVEAIGRGTAPALGSRTTSVGPATPASDASVDGSSSSPTPGPSGLVRYRRQQRARVRRATLLRSLGVRPWTRSLVLVT
ncbi:MAG: hypothetical protein ACTHN0_11180 [Aquihabitans sp.]